MFPGMVVSCGKERAGRRPAATRISETKKKTEIVYPGVADPRAAEGSLILELRPGTLVTVPNSPITYV